jgi:hypothetical protein
MKKITMTLGALIVFAAWPPIGAQAENQTLNEPGTAGLQQQKQQSITGCLTAGEEGSYILTTQDAQQVSVTGSPELAKHIGHTVKLTGTIVESSEQPAFAASEVKMVAPKCDM